MFYVMSNCSLLSMAEFQLLLCVYLFIHICFFHRWFRFPSPFPIYLYSLLFMCCFLIHFLFIHSFILLFIILFFYFFRPLVITSKGLFSLAFTALRTVPFNHITFSSINFKFSFVLTLIVLPGS